MKKIYFYAFEKVQCEFSFSNPKFEDREGDKLLILKPDYVMGYIQKDNVQPINKPISQVIQDNADKAFTHIFAFLIVEENQNPYVMLTTTEADVKGQSTRFIGEKIDNYLTGVSYTQEIIKGYSPIII